MQATQKTNFTGEVVQIIDEAGSKKIKILTLPQYLETTIDCSQEIHLGDKVLLLSVLDIQKVTQIIFNNDYNKRNRTN